MADYKTSLCQICARKIGTCSWEKNFTPVPGWEAIPTTLQGYQVQIKSYKVISCPLFIQPKKRK